MSWNDRTRKTVSFFLGCLAFFCMLELALRLGGPLFALLQDSRNTVSLRGAEGTCRIMCLGDSTTALGGKDAYPLQLEKILNGKKGRVQFSVINKGAILVDTSYIAQHLEENVDRYEPAIVTIMAGINDKGAPGAVAAGNHTFWENIKTYTFARLLIRSIRDRSRAEFQAARAVGARYPVEVSLKKRIDANPGDVPAYVELGRFYRESGRYGEAEQALSAARGLNGRDYTIFLETGLTYLDQADYPAAEEMFRQALAIDPRYMAYMELAFACKFQGKYEEAITAVKAGIELDPKGYAWGYSELGFCYKAQGKYAEAEEMLNKSIELLPRYFWAYVELVDCYKTQGKYVEAEAVLKKAILADPDDDKGYAELGRLYKEMGMRADAQENLVKADAIRRARYATVTGDNYRRIKRILDRRGIRLVCVQYPLRGIKPLREMFSDDESVVFVDNEKIFRDAVARDGFARYFDDIFAGDFGHCNARGNRLIAENIARAIRDKVRLGRQ